MSRSLTPYPLSPERGNLFASGGQGNSVPLHPLWGTVGASPAPFIEAALETPALLVPYLHRL